MKRVNGGNDGYGGTNDNSGNLTKKKRWEKIKSKYLLTKKFIDNY